MSILTTADARAQCHYDDDDEITDDLLQPFIDGAEAAAAAYLNRAIYANDAALTAAQDAIPAMIGTATSAYANAVAAAAELASPEGRQAALLLASVRLDAAKLVAQRTIYGMVANAAVLSAIRLTIGHLCANREDVIAGASAAAIQMPSGAQSFLRPHRRGMMP